MAAPKRAVVLRLAELERYPTTRARYEATLPFEVGGFNFQDSRCDCPHPRPDGRRNYNCQGTCDASISFAKLMEKAIRQTEKRWVWFSEARKLDDTLGRRLGTLGYLPWDIREMIWSLVIDNHKESFREPCFYEQREQRLVKFDENWLNAHLSFGPSDFWWFPKHNKFWPHDKNFRVDIFDLRSYYPRGSSHYGGAMKLRFTSPQLKTELENAFIFGQAFRFFCPIHMGQFLDQLSADHRPLLRSITMVLHGCGYGYRRGTSSIIFECRAWVAIIERLPATLQLVIFEFDHRLPPASRRRNSNTFNRDMALLEVMTKKVRRQAPRAKISVAGLTDRCDDYGNSLQNIVDELEPFSEDFMKWSDQSRKNATE